MHLRKLRWVGRFSMRFLLWVLLVAASLLFTLYILLEHTTLGTYGAKELTDWVARRYGVNIAIERVSIKLPASLELQQTIVYDLKGDTLLWAERASTALVGLANMGRELHFGHTELHNARLNLKADSAGVLNINKLIDAFRSPNPKKIKKPFKLTIEQILFSDLCFSMWRGAGETKVGRFSPQNLEFQKIGGLIKYLQVAGDTVRMEIPRLAFHERSGFAAESFHTRLAICSHYMHFQDIELRQQNQELHIPNFRMTYDGWASMKDFVNNVSLFLEVSPSVLTPRLFSYFVPLPEVSDYPFYVSGYATGTIADLHVASLDIRTADATHLALQASLQGLPKVHDAVVNVRVKEFTTSLADVRQVINGMRLARLNLPAFANKINNLTYRGDLVGFLDDFVAYGRITSDVGDIGIDVSLRLEDNATTSFEGKVATKRLHVGKLLNVRELGRTDLLASISGRFSKLGGMKSHARMAIDNLEFRDYTYRNISGDGYITPKSYAGELAVRDSAFQFNFQGNVDFTTEVPKFQFAAKAQKIDLKKINWYEKDSVAVLAFDVSAFFEGRKIDDLLGNIAFAQLSYANQNGIANLDGLRLTAFNEGDGKYITAESVAFYLSLWTDRRYDRFIPSMKTMLSERLPALFMPKEREGDAKSPILPKDELEEHVLYRASLIAGDSQNLFSVLLPNVYIAPRSELKFDYNATTRKLDLRIKSERIGYNNIEAQEVNIDLQNRDSMAQLDLRIRQGQLAALTIDTFAVRADLTKDQIHTAFGIHTPDVGGGVLKMESEAQFVAASDEAPTHLVLSFLPSFLQVQERQWRFSRARIYVDSAAVEVLNLSAQFEDKRFSIAGRISKNNGDTLRLALDNVDLAPLTTLLPQYKLQGLINGYVSIASPIPPLNLLGQLELTNLAINDTYVGSSELAVRWAGIENPFLLNFENKQANGQKDIMLNASWNLQGKEFDGTLKLDKCKLQLLDLFTQNVLSAEGYVNANLRVRGSAKQPKLEGTLAFQDAMFTLKQFNTQIITNDKVSLHDDGIFFNNFQAKDQNEHELALNGKIDIATITRPVFELTASTQQFRALNTPASDELYYGQLWISSLTRLWGTIDNLRLETALRTEPGTQLYFQLPSYAEAKENKLIEFVEPPSAQKEGIRKSAQSEKKKKSTLSYTIDLNVTNDALTQLLVNPRTGDLLRCRGEGQLRIESEPNTNNVHIFGDYTIQRGEYTFILQGILSKKFKINAGSVIHFSGAPELAIAQIEASYRVKAALNRLIVSASTDKYKRRIPVDCKIQIQGSLQSPRIQFKIDVPQADPETQGLLAAALNTDEKLMRQFASLLLTGNFTSEGRNEQLASTQPGVQNSRSANNTDGGDNNNVLLSSFMELIFNNLNSWIAQIENAPAIDLGFNYRPGDTYTKDEAELSVSMQWFDGRLNVDANWDVNRNNTSSVVAGDINVTQQSGILKNLQYKAFARSNDDLVFSDLSPYTAGVGVVFSDSFNSWAELVQRIKELFSRKPKQEEAITIPNDTENAQNDENL